jgi:HTH-type transcriptional regulator/antitoxin MqsA
VQDNVQIIREDECRLCTGALKWTTESADIRVGSNQVSLDVRRRRCDSCGEVFYAPSEIRDLQKRAAAIIRERDGLLTPEQIHRVREKVRLSQAAIEKILFVGKKTFLRWESGQIAQSGAADTLLRVINEFPHVLTFLARLRNIPLAESLADVGSKTPIMNDPTFGRPDIVSITPFIARKAKGLQQRSGSGPDLAAPQTRATTKLALG